MGVVSSDLQEEMTLRLAEIIKGVAREDEQIIPSWAERFPDPQSEVEEIEARHAATYPNEGTL